MLSMSSSRKMSGQCDAAFSPSPIEPGITYGVKIDNIDKKILVVTSHQKVCPGLYK